MRITSIGVLTALAVLALLAPTSRATETVPKPNILVLLEVHDLARTARFAPELKQLRARCDELRAGASAQASVESAPAMPSDLPIIGLPTVNVKTFGAPGDCEYAMDGAMAAAPAGQCSFRRACIAWFTRVGPD